MKKLAFSFLILNNIHPWGYLEIWLQILWAKLLFMGDFMGVVKCHDWTTGLGTPAGFVE